MKNTPLVLTALALLFVATVPLQAQGGCVNSPENPTAVLAAIGSAGAIFFSRRMRLK